MPVGTIKTLKPTTNAEPRSIWNPDNCRDLSAALSEFYDESRTTPPPKKDLPPQQFSSVGRPTADGRGGHVGGREKSGPRWAIDQREVGGGSGSPFSVAAGEGEVASEALRFGVGRSRAT
ncbi:hypothetical protein Trydic_g14503 [Trypoxylus dichotomus]